MLVNQRWYQSSDIIFDGRVVLCSSKQFSHRLVRETSSAHLQHAKILKLNLKNFMLPHFAQNITQMQSFWRKLRNMFTLTKQFWSVLGRMRPFCKPLIVSPDWKSVSLYLPLLVMVWRALTVSFYNINFWGRCVDKTSDQNREQWLALFSFKSEL